MTRTEWFPGTVKPVRPGVYETSADPTEYVLYDYFDGERWHDGLNERGRIYAEPAPFKWRGLTEESK